MAPIWFVVDQTKSLSVLMCESLFHLGPGHQYHSSLRLVPVRVSRSGVTNGVTNLFESERHLMVKQRATTLLS